MKRYTVQYSISDALNWSLAHVRARDETHARAKVARAWRGMRVNLRLGDVMDGFRA